VTPRICPRCHAALHREDEGSLVFCWNCGAPQVQLSEELRDQIDQQISAQQSAANPSAEPVPQPIAPSNAIIWRGAIQTAGLAGAVTAALTLISFALPPVSVLSFMWFISAPIVVLGVYSSRFHQTRITTGFGARLGLLTGLAILIATSTLNTIALVLERFVFHSTAAIDAQVANVFTQMHLSITAQSGPAAKAALDMLAIPEFRAGLLLTSITIGLAFYLAFSATAGAFAGYLRSRSPRA
jgi:Zn ribbon nucleic-acid-binding protein